MINLNTNLSSLIAQNSLAKATGMLDQAIERMSTGYKVNHASDNAAGYSIATNMDVKISSYNIALDNASLGLSLVDTASSNLELVTTHLQRMRDLTVQALNGTYGANSIAAIQAEVDARAEEITRIISNTEYNGIKIFEPDDSSKKILVDESKRVVNQTSFNQNETYYLTSSEDLVKLQDLVNAGVDTTNVTFELAENINMRGVDFTGIGDDSNRFKGTFNGNEKVISNLTIDTTDDFVGLFGYIDSGAVVDSLGLENCAIKGNFSVGGLAGQSLGNITNSYVVGSVVGTDDYVGGLVGYSSGDISDSYSKGNVEGFSKVGGLAGYSDSIINSYSKSNVKGSSNVGGLTGYASGNVSNSYATGLVNANSDVGGLIGYSNNSVVSDGYFNTETTGQVLGVGNGAQTGVDGVTTTELKNLIARGILPEFDGIGALASGREFTLQIGIDASEHSTITFDTALGFKLSIDVTSKEGAGDALNDIDNILELVDKKQVDFGTVQNRLDSVIDSLGINIENLTSSLSTIKDADIAQVSSDYIKYQILQQASATLLSTANQAPSIALQLL